MKKVRNVSFVFSKVDMGSVADSGDMRLKTRKDRFFLDVGNGLYKGVIDHHHKNEGEHIAGQVYRSAAKLVTANTSLILGNLSENVSRVEIIWHDNPDFDCYAAAYLTKYLIEYDTLPEGYEAFAEYADEVDAGRSKISRDNLKEVFAVAYGIDSICRDNLLDRYKEIQLFEKESTGELIKLAEEKKSSNISHDRVLEIVNRISQLEQAVRDKYSAYKDILEESVRNRWFLLFDRVLEWINTNKGHRLAGADIFGSLEEFRKEINFVQQDYTVYQNEMEENNGSWEKMYIMLPKAGDISGRLYEVPGLVFNDVPKSKLTKNWARIDTTNSSETGFVFTFIPLFKERPMVLKKDYREEEVIVDGEPVMVSKAIISVDPNSGYCLKGLAEQLERAECEKEDEVFRTFNDKKRDKNRRRPGFIDDWCTNDDTWYDGRNFNNTIVDVPRRGSLLTIGEIKEITLNFTVAKVTKASARIVIPFTFNHEEYGRICAKPDAYFMKTGEVCSEDYNDYFLEYIRDFLFCNNEIKVGFPGCTRIGLNMKKYLVAEKSKGIWTLYSEANKEELREHYIVELKPFKATIFKYGVGFVCIEISYWNDCLYFNELLDINHKIREVIRQICSDSIIIKSDIGRTCQKPLLYSALEIDSEGCFESEKLKMIYKLCNIDKWEELYSESAYVRSALEKLLLEIDDNCSYGFSKSGGAIFCIRDRSQEFVTVRNIEKQIELFNSINFEIFIFVLQQRISLMKFEKMLAEFDGESRTNQVKRLRGLLMNFITQGWFSQVTNHEIGQEIFRKWQQVMECEKLYQEVLEQIQSVDDYRHSRSSKFYENVSILLFPALFILQVLSSGLLRAKTIWDGIDWWYSIGIIIATTALTLYIVKRRKDKTH